MNTDSIEMDTTTTTTTAQPGRKPDDLGNSVSDSMDIAKRSTSRPQDFDRTEQKLLDAPITPGLIPVVIMMFGFLLMTPMLAYAQTQIPGLTNLKGLVDGVLGQGMVIAMLYGFGSVAFALAQGNGMAYQKLIIGVSALAIWSSRTVIMNTMGLK